MVLDTYLLFGTLDPSGFFIGAVVRPLYMGLYRDHIESSY